MVMQTGAEPRRVLAGLGGFYEAAIPLSWLVVRIAAGSILIGHGFPKLFRPVADMAPGYSAMGLQPGAFWAVASMAVEFGGGVAIVLGLFTRVFATAAAVEMAVITSLYLANGFSWLHRGYEYTLMWGLLCFAIALRGGGPYSVDRLIGREL